MFMSKVPNRLSDLCFLLDQVPADTVSMTGEKTPALSSATLVLVVQFIFHCHATVCFAEITIMLPRLSGNWNISKKRV